jgi:hypothetical protein
MKPTGLIIMFYAFSIGFFALTFAYDKPGADWILIFAAGNLSGVATMLRSMNWDEKP